MLLPGPGTTTLVHHLLHTSGYTTAPTPLMPRRTLHRLCTKGSPLTRAVSERPVTDTLVTAEAWNRTREPFLKAGKPGPGPSCHPFHCWSRNVLERSCD